MMYSVHSYHMFVSDYKLSRFEIAERSDQEFWNRMVAPLGNQPRKPRAEASARGADCREAGERDALKQRRLWCL